MSANRQKGYEGWVVNKAVAAVWDFHNMTACCVCLCCGEFLLADSRGVAEGLLGVCDLAIGRCASGIVNASANA
jgi:hypothetical protein